MSRHILKECSADGLGACWCMKNLALEGAALAELFQGGRGEGGGSGWPRIQAAACFFRTPPNKSEREIHFSTWGEGAAVGFVGTQGSGLMQACQNPFIKR